MKNYYQILELEPNATPEQIKTQYRFLSHAWHPDKFPTPDQKAKAEEKIKEINEAYKVLSYSTEREVYDRALRNSSTSSAQKSTQSQTSKNTSSTPTKNRCESCGIAAETKYIEFYENVGLIIFRQHRSIKGNLCKHCINYYFWSLTGKTMLLGWWGVISFIVTPFILLNNLLRYLFTISINKPLLQIAPSPSLFWILSTLGGFLLIGVFFFSTFSVSYSQPDYIPSPTKTPMPTKLPTRSATKRIVPTPTPTCLKWDKVTPQMEGQEICVYGVVSDHVENFDAQQTFFYFGDRNHFFLTSLLRWSGTEGSCISVIGKVQLNTYQTPYIKIENEILSCP